MPSERRERVLPNSRPMSVPLRANPARRYARARAARGRGRCVRQAPGTCRKCSVVLRRCCCRLPLSHATSSTPPPLTPPPATARRRHLASVSPRRWRIVFPALSPRRRAGRSIARRCRSSSPAAGSARAIAVSSFFAARHATPFVSRRFACRSARGRKQKDFSETIVEILFLFHFSELFHILAFVLFCLSSSFHFITAGHFFIYFRFLSSMPFLFLADFRLHAIVCFLLRFSLHAGLPRRLRCHYAIIFALCMPDFFAITGDATRLLFCRHFRHGARLSPPSRLLMPCHATPAFHLSIIAIREQCKNKRPRRCLPTCRHDTPGEHQLRPHQSPTSSSSPARGDELAAYSNRRCFIRLQR